MAVVAVGQVVATFFTCRARDIDALATFTRQLGGIHLLKLDASRTAATPCVLKETQGLGTKE